MMTIDYYEMELPRQFDNSQIGDNQTFSESLGLSIRNFQSNEVELREDNIKRYTMAEIMPVVLFIGLVSVAFTLFIVYLIQ